MLETITDKTWNLMNPGVALVYFAATWCAPCQTFKPILEELACAYPNIHFYYADVTENTGVASEYHITSVPTLALFKNKVPVAVHVGASSKARIEAWLRST